MKFATFGMLLLALAAPLQAQAPDVVPAFYGVRGFGWTALNQYRQGVLDGSKELKVFKITTTDCLADGGLRRVMVDSMNAYPDAYKVVLAWVGGRTSNCSGVILAPPANSSGLYFHGGLAPGGGHEFRAHIETRGQGYDRVFRYLTFRSLSSENIQFSGTRLVVDHYTSAWSATQGGRNLITVSGDTTTGYSNRVVTDSVTVMHSMAYEPDSIHPTASHHGGQPKSSPPTSYHSAWRNLYMGPGRRMPLCSARFMKMANTLTYNWDSQGNGFTYSQMSTDNEGICDWISVYIKRGPATRTTGRSSYALMEYEGCKLEYSGAGDGVCTKSYYLTDVRSAENSYLGSTDDEIWRGATRNFVCDEIGYTPNDCNVDGDTVTVQFRRYTPIDDAAIPLLTPPITDSIVSLVLDSVGNNQQIQCDGTWVARRDTIDANRITHFETGTGTDGIHHAPTYWVGRPAPSAGTACTDTDNDGLPDAYESAHSASTTALDPASDADNDGWLAIDELLQGTDPNSLDTWPLSPVTRRRRYYLLAYATMPSGRPWYKVPGTATVLPDTLKLSPYQFNDTLDIIVTYDSVEVGGLQPISNDSLQSLCVSADLDCGRIQSRDVPGSTAMGESSRSLPLLAAALPSRRTRGRRR